MKITQLAVQLYTCRDLIQDSAGLAATLKRLRKIGYTAVEVAALGPVPEPELNRMLDDLGLTCCATHEPPLEILKDPAKIVERLQALRCKIASYPYPAEIDFSSRADVRRLIRGLQRAGETLAQAGQTLCYHNHNHEFRKLEGRVILDLIYEGTAPEALKAELDTFWVHLGGGDIVDWCRKLTGRLPIMHLKDYQTTAENKPRWCESGAGNLDLKRIVAAAETAGCQWFVVEQDTCPGDPVDSLAQSFRYLQENVVS